MDKEILTEKRGLFFTEVLEALRRPPTRIDVILKQDKFYRPIDEENTFFDAGAGDLAISVKGEFHGKEFNFYYSFWQLGDTLRIGVAIYDEELQGAFASDAHNEVFYIWGMKNDPRVDVAHDCVFYDWEFEVDDLYDSYKRQEKFILGARHMHFRVMRIIHDECQRIYYVKNRDEGELDGGFSGFDDFDKILKGDK